MVKKWMGKTCLKLAGWTTDVTLKHDKFVLIAAPHTSNWDLTIMLATAWSKDMKIRWMGKNSLFRFPLKTIMTGLGGLSVDRSKRNNLVDQAAALFKSRESLILAVPPEGTRGGGATGWRSGFYYIALAAGVPIVLGSLDYANKVSAFGPSVWPSGDMAADMDKIRAYYRPDMARYPDKFLEPRLRGETEPTVERPAQLEGGA